MGGFFRPVGGLIGAFFGFGGSFLSISERPITRRITVQIPLVRSLGQPFVPFTLSFASSAARRLFSPGLSSCSASRLPSNR
jgi:hypothetical protein